MKLRILFSIIPLFIILFGTTSECPKIGLVLSGGAARGFAHIGTLKMLDSLNLEIPDSLQELLKDEQKISPEAYEYFIKAKYHKGSDLPGFWAHNNPTVCFYK